MPAPRLCVLIVATCVVALGWSRPAGPAGAQRPTAPLIVPPQGGQMDEGEVTPTPAQRDVARDLVRVFVIQLEQYQAHPELRNDASLRTVASVLAKADPRARQRLMDGVARFAVQAEPVKRQFFGNLYGPTIEARAAQVPKALSFIRAQPLTIKAPLVPPRRDGEPRVEPVFFRRPAPAAAAGYNYGAAILRSIQVVSQNDDNAADEIYFGLCNFGALQPSYFRVPKGGNGYWTITGTDTIRPATRLVKFTAPKDPFWVNSVISVFEEDDGTWNEIAPLLITAASLALEAYLASEIGTVLAEIVMSFLDDLFEWFEGLITNDDDYIGTFGTKALIYKGKTRWNETGSRYTRDRSYRITGEDADYRITLYWELVK